MTTPPLTDPDQKKNLASEPDILASIVPESISTQSDRQDAVKAIAEESQYLDNVSKRTEILGTQQDISERKQYASKLYVLIACWLVAILLILLLAGFKNIYIPTCNGWFTTSFSLSDAVLLALIGSTTTTVIGLFVVVVNYLFPQRK